MKPREKSISKRSTGLSRPGKMKAKKTDIGFRNMEVIDELDKGCLT